MEAAGQSMPVGRSGRLEAVALTGPDGDHAVLVRQAEQPRALLVGQSAGSRDRLVVTPLDEDVEIRVDGDALAVWLASAPVVARTSVPTWARVVGLVVVLLVVAFTVIGGAVVAGWLVDVLT